MNANKTLDNPNPRASANPLSKLIFGYVECEISALSVGKDVISQVARKLCKIEVDIDVLEI